jgi:hypothetical protein
MWKTLKLRLANIWKSKTAYFAVILGSFGLIKDSLPDLQQYLTPQMYGHIFVASSLIVLVLRLVTTQGLEDK